MSVTLWIKIIIILEVLKVKKIILFCVIFVILLFPSFLIGKTKIVYWQYYYETKVKLVDELIQIFEKENPDIEVEHVTFPYENFNQKVAASIPAGTGPDVVNIYYGWIPKYVTSGYLQPLPKDIFTEKYLEDNFFPFVLEGINFLNDYYVLPTAVRSLALFWNKDLFSEKGLDPEVPPQTLEELVEYAIKLTEYDKAGNITQAGLATETGGQMHHWIREVLVRQFGGVPYDDSNKMVLYHHTPEALEFYTNLITKYKVSYPGFMNDDVTAFISGRAAMNIDGSFRLGTLEQVGTVDFGVAELPSHNNIQSNFASFWANGITKNAKGDKLDASVKFVKFLSSPEVMERWLKEVGELPANPKIAERYYDDPIYGPFLKGLNYAHITFFADETGQRQVMLDAVDKVWLKKIDPKIAFEEAAKEEQLILDKFWSTLE